MTVAKALRRWATHPAPPLLENSGAYDMSDRLALAVDSEVAEKPASLLPVFKGNQMAAAIVAYRELQEALDKGMPDQIMQIQGRPFRKKGYWRAVARAFNLNLACVKEVEDAGEGDRDWGWHVIYRATTPAGAFAEGDGSCYASEKKHNDTQHNVRAHAHTRAYNRAVSNLVGFGEVSAEEVRHDEQVPTEARAIPDMRPTVARDLPKGAQVIIRVDHVTGAKTKGWAHLSDRSKLPMYSSGLVELADEVCKTREPVWLETKQSATGNWYLTGIKRQGPDTPMPEPMPEPPPVTDEDFQ